MNSLWWRWGESNSWPPACKAGALPAELHPRLGCRFGHSLYNTSLKLLDIQAYCLRRFALSCKGWRLQLNFCRLCVSRDCRVLWYAIERKHTRYENLVGLSGLEPPTSRLSGVRSNRLSYRPMQGILWGLISLIPTFHILMFNVHLWTLENKQYRSWSTNRNFDRQYLLLVGSP